MLHLRCLLLSWMEMASKLNYNIRHTFLCPKVNIYILRSVRLLHLYFQVDCPYLYRHGISLTEGRDAVEPCYWGTTVHCSYSRCCPCSTVLALPLLHLIRNWRNQPFSGRSFKHRSSYLGGIRCLSSGTTYCNSLQCRKGISPSKCSYSSNIHTVRTRQ